MNLPISKLTKNEWILWIVSLCLVVISNLLSPGFDFLTLIAALIGVTALIFGAKGNVWAQILIIIFSVLYGIISWRFRYYGEMVTYLGMTLPMAVRSAITWFKNPSEENESEVKVNIITGKMWCILSVLTIVVTIVFFFILKYFDTPNIIFSTLSVTTSFMAAMLTMLRSSYFALFYAMNDLVLIVLWIYASVSNPVYIPVIVNFAIFFVNDSYGYVSWKKRERVLLELKSEKI